MAYKEAKGPSWSNIPAQIFVPQPGNKLLSILNLYCCMKYLWVRHTRCVSAAPSTIGLISWINTVSNPQWWYQGQCGLFFSSWPSYLWTSHHMYLSNIWLQLISVREKVHSWVEFPLGLRHLGACFSVRLGGVCVLLNHSGCSSQSPGWITHIRQILYMIEILCMIEMIFLQRSPLLFHLTIDCFFCFISCILSHNTSRK